MCLSKFLPIYMYSKIGVIGLVEQEWIETLSTLHADDVIYESFVEAGNRLAQELRDQDVNILIIYYLFLQ